MATGLHNLGDGLAHKRRKRVGRGIGSGHGKTSGRGHKGQLARSGGGKGPGFEGGQTPLVGRVPIRGFNNKRFALKFACVNVRDLNRFAPGSTVTPEDLKQAGILKKLGDGVKVLGEGELDRPLTVRAHRFSKAALEKIQAAGGKAEVI
ncbi:MAG: 50S ribosomal protein L15 [Firmicutes bacterium]|nr:50S ribosomal protein L15 [Bacillota bacterium]